MVLDALALVGLIDQTVEAADGESIEEQMQVVCQQIVRGGGLQQAEAVIGLCKGIDASAELLLFGQYVLVSDDFSLDDNIIFREILADFAFCFDEPQVEDGNLSGDGDDGGD